MVHLSPPISGRSRQRRWFLLFLVGLWCLAAGTAAAEPVLRCLWTPPRVRGAAPPGVASIQYTQLFDEEMVRLLARALPPDRTFRFRYDQERPDDYVLPNGVPMKQMHEWLSRAIEVWNREPLMPVRLNLERGQTETEHVIRLDEDSSQTAPNTGVGGYSLRTDGTNVEFRCQAVFNVSEGSLTRAELVEALVKHELGHCMTLHHSSSRASVMGYSTGGIDYAASGGQFALDDLLGLRSVWARGAPGFGALSGRLLYPDGSVVGGGDVVAVDDPTGEVLATSVSDPEQGGRFRIELPAGRSVRLVAHPLHADTLLFGDHFLPTELLTPQDFAPTELATGDRGAVFAVPEAATRDLGEFTVAGPPDPPLLNRDAPSAALLPGERRHVAFRFDGLDPASVRVHLSLVGLSVSHLTAGEDRIEFDVTAAPDLGREGATGRVSFLEVRSGPSRNLQVGSLWVRPTVGLTRLTRVDPITLVRGQTIPVTLHGHGLERVTGVRIISEDGESELPSRDVRADDGGATVEITVPDEAADGPWDLVLLTPEGEAPRWPEPRPKLWIGTGRVRADAGIDLGEVTIGQPVEFAVPLTNLSSAPYRLSQYEWRTWVGEAEEVQVIDAPTLAPGAAGTFRVALTPSRLGPTVMTVRWGSEGRMDAATEIRLWGVPDVSRQ